MRFLFQKQPAPGALPGKRRNYFCAALSSTIILLQALAVVCASRLSNLGRRLSKAGSPRNKLSNVASIFGIYPKGNGYDYIGANAHATFKVIALAVLDQVIHDKNRKEEDYGLESLEVEGHGLADDPT
ncbi:hypothetical protein AC579_3295 [Pseudocercospora musae]|uniref:Uncharacterized protein n=1 Tax=Pseudocercospora musae TaxID=113226 RepID=A0A139I9L9_9PEZI|nr:hypothetical protein AC579_3295 [Pseudocercospora musae]